MCNKSSRTTSCVEEPLDYDSLAADRSLTFRDAAGARHRVTNGHWLWTVAHDHSIKGRHSPTTTKDTAHGFRPRGSAADPRVRHRPPDRPRHPRARRDLRMSRMALNIGTSALVVGDVDAYEDAASLMRATVIYPSLIVEIVERGVTQYVRGSAIRLAANR
ncbi:hypothetical protein Q3G72_004841 [Acer saccharum]|nr:hypothetical protein Q3G72_004841 [Acer saccharum]